MQIDFLRKKAVVGFLKDKGADFYLVNYTSFSVIQAESQAWYPINLIT